VFPRVREIVDERGDRLRVNVDVDMGGALMTLEFPDGMDAPRVVLDALGAELLAGYLMSARLALPHGLPDETADRGLVRRLRLVLTPLPLIEILQGAAGITFEIPSRYWDKLYAELCLVVAHMRDRGRAPLMRVH